MKKQIIEKNYQKYRWFFTSSGILVVGGKSDKQNEEAIHDFLNPDYIVMHTSLPGSPFCIIQSEKPSKKDMDEAAVFCASFSQQWKSGKREIMIDVFYGKQIYKSKLMKIGTFGVKGEVKKINVSPKLFLTMQKGKIRAVPFSTKGEAIAEIRQGELNKDTAANKVFKIIKEKYQFPISKEEIMQALPADKLEVYNL